MKISDIYQKTSLIRNSETLMPHKPEAREEAASLEAADGTGASVDLSSRSVELSRVAEHMDRDAPERAARLNEIRAKILNGTYDVESSRVADKMLKEAIRDLPKT